MTETTNEGDEHCTTHKFEGSCLHCECEFVRMNVYEHTNKEKRGESKSCFVMVQKRVVRTRYTHTHTHTHTVSHTHTTYKNIYIRASHAKRIGNTEQGMVECLSHYQHFTLLQAAAAQSTSNPSHPFPRCKAACL